MIIPILFTAWQPQIEMPYGGGWRTDEIVQLDTSSLETAIPWLLTETLTITTDGHVLSADLDYTWNDSTQTLTIFPNPVGISRTLILRCRTAAIIDSSRFYTFPHIEKSEIPLSQKPDSSQFPQPGRSSLSSPLSPWGKLHRRGSLTRGIKFGSDETGISSGLHLELTGQPTPGMTVDAVLDDSNIPATSAGGSATLSELDRLLFRVKTSNITTELGDWDIDWSKGSLGTIRRQLKGGKLGVEIGEFQTEIAAAGSDRTYHSVAFLGREGDQGPYELTDRSGRSGVVIATNSEKVYIDARLLNRGLNSDYTIDYQRGTITFNPSVPIRNNSRIEVEFQYSDGSYSRFFYGSTAGFDRPEKEGFSVRASAVTEGRDQKRPLAFDWNEAWTEVAKNAGDNIYGAAVSGVDTVDEGTGDYIWVNYEGVQVLEFVPPDSSGRPAGNLQVYFSRVNGGGYERVWDADLRFFYFKWAGEGTGNWAPVRHLPLPDRLTHTSLVTGFRSKELRVTAEAALSDLDRNTLSSLEDEDNIGSAWTLSGAWGIENDDPVSISVTAQHREADYTAPERSIKPDFNYLWGITDSTRGTESTIESVIGVKPVRYLDLKGSAGWLNRVDVLNSQHLGLNASSALGIIGLRSGIDRTETHNHNSKVDSRRTTIDGSVFNNSGYILSEYRIHSEQTTCSDTGAKRIDHNLILKKAFSPTKKLQVSAFYRSEDITAAGDEFHWLDTRTFQASWKSRHPGSGGWTADIQRSFTTFTDASMADLSSTSAVVGIIRRSQSSPWSFTGDYFLTTGNDRVRTSTASYVGENRGDYRREGDRYVPDPDGEFTFREILTDTIKRVSSVKMNSTFSWDFTQGRGEGAKGNPPLGITGSTTKIRAGITTGKKDPLSAFVLLPAEFKSRSTLLSSVSILQDFDFLQGNPTGDGRLSFSLIEDRDRYVSGGESNNRKAVSLRIRKPLGEVVRSRIQPRWEHTLRRGLSRDEIRSEVTALGGELETILDLDDLDFEPALAAGYEFRRDDLHSKSVIERSLKPRISWFISPTSSLRLEGRWLNLATDSENAGYDLMQSWERGNNFTVSLNADYRLHSNLTLTAYYYGRWRGHRSPRHTGLIELTASL